MRSIESIDYSPHTDAGGGLLRLKTPEEVRLISLLSGNRRTAAVEFISGELAPKRVRRALDKGQRIEAEYGAYTPVSLKKTGDAAIGIRIKDIDIKTLNQTTGELTVGDIERNLGEKIKSGYKGRLNIKITPNVVEVTLEQADYFGGKWSSIRPDDILGLQTPQAVAHLISRIDFAGAERNLEKEEQNQRVTGSPRDVNYLYPESSPKARLAQQLREAEEALREAEEALAQRRKNVSDLGHLAKYLSGLDIIEQQRVDLAEDALYRARRALQQEIERQEAAAAASTQSQIESSQLHQKPWKGKGKKRGSSYQRKRRL